MSLVGQDLSGPQVLLARPVLEGLARTAVELNELPDPQASGPYPAELDFPGMFQFGGFNAAAALVAPAPLWIYGASSAIRRLMTKTAYATERSRHVLRLEPRPSPAPIRSRNGSIRVTDDGSYNAPRRSSDL